MLRPKDWWKSGRRSIEHTAPQHFVGWKRILELYETAYQLDMIMRDQKDLDSGKPRRIRSLYFNLIFQTGCRISEVLDIQPHQILWNDTTIKIENVTVLKRRRRFTRNIFIKIEGNPLAHRFIEHVLECDTRYLLPGYGVPGRKTIDPESPISRTYIYKKIREIDPDVWPHWIRDQRSWHLSADIEKDGRGFDSYLLKEWYAWASIEMPTHYAGRRGEKDILTQFGVPDTTSRPEE